MRQTKTTAGLVGVMLGCLLLVGVAPSFAQSLGDVARKERTRKQGQPRRATRVLTAEDLVRPKILPPEDRARLEDQGQSTDVAPGAAAPTAAEVPLGDIARYYRALKQKRAAEENSDTTPAPATVAEEILAAPSPDASLGDVARYYRALKQAREKQEVAGAPKLVVPPALAYPAFSRRLPIQPDTRAWKAPESRPLRSAEAKQKPMLIAPDGAVRVVRGDSLWKLAEQYLGRGSSWRKLVAANPHITNPNLIHAGAWIRLPHGAARAAKQARVNAGDSLWKLAKAELGTGLAWNCIARANPQIHNPNRIQPGQLLTIPSSCSVAP